MKIAKTLNSQFQFNLQLVTDWNHQGTLDRPQNKFTSVRGGYETSSDLLKEK